ncbi:MAG: urate hydroxylase PuuD [Planctomycetes bacterium]|nr:urate hydroxylase PuuD [Planctomycetota bacterium]
MDPTTSEWLNLALRWIHIVAGAFWIGQTNFFGWLERSFLPTKEPKDNVVGHAWMVHSGGFFYVEKRKFTPGVVPEPLHWFKWEAGLTWLTGFFLLGIVYYHTGLHARDGAAVGSAGATLAGLGFLLGGWFGYDRLFRNLLGKNELAGAAIGFVLILVTTYALTLLMSDRGAYIHIGAMFGTIMAANVWFRILPAQQRMLDATRAGRPADYSFGEEAKQRSKHNTYLTIPLVFLMVSNHFPTTSYGTKSNGLMLGVFVLVGWMVRWYMNDKEDRATARRLGGEAAKAHESAAVGPIIGLAALALLGILITTGGGGNGPHGGHHAGGGNGAQPGAGVQPTPIDPAQAGTVAGTVSFAGTAPARKKMGVGGVPECARYFQDEPDFDNDVLVENGRLANVFIAVVEGLDPRFVFAPPGEPLRIQNRLCRYEPRVSGAMVGQEVLFVNEDETMHNVRVLAHRHGALEELLNKSLVAKGSKTPAWRFDEESEPLRLECNVHGWMAGALWVLPHPYFAVSAADGTWKFATRLPTGTYVLEAWHERLGKKTRKEVRVGPGEAVTVDFSFP